VSALTAFSLSALNASAQSRQASPGVARPLVHRFAVTGAWSAADWGDVVIGPDGAGSYSSTYGTGPGRLQLRPVGERRYEGSWGESAQRFGTLVLELSPDGQRITGSWTPDPQSTIGTRTGGSIAWTRRP
jgi:hypothetical protein